MKTAFIFPGQGAQYAGMGRELFDNHPEAREVFEEADRVLGFSLSSTVLQRSGRRPEDYGEHAAGDSHGFGCGVPGASSEGTSARLLLPATVSASIRRWSLPAR